jgi:hypothetical protein
MLAEFGLRAGWNWTAVVYRPDSQDASTRRPARRLYSQCLAPILCRRCCSAGESGAANLWLETTGSPRHLWRVFLGGRLLICSTHACGALCERPHTKHSNVQQTSRLGVPF